VIYIYNDDPAPLPRRSRSSLRPIHALIAVALVAAVLLIAALALRQSGLIVLATIPFVGAGIVILKVHEENRFHL
jgi:hypothetical protein